MVYVCRKTEDLEVGGGNAEVGKEINERRTSNIERPTSNNVVCLLIKERAKGIYPAEFNLTQPATGSGSDYYKIDKAQRNQNSMFGVGRSMFDSFSISSEKCFIWGIIGQESDN